MSLISKSSTGGPNQQQEVAQLITEEIFNRFGSDNTGAISKDEARNIYLEKIQQIGGDQAV